MLTWEIFFLYKILGAKIEAVNGRIDPLPLLLYAHCT